MINGKKVLGIIPARAGSKRLLNKNILELAGKPLIAWTIESAINSDVIDKVVVSTDSEEIKKVALDLHANVPFMRPSELSGDTASSIDVVKHAIKFLKREGDVYDIIVLLQPTSPLRSAKNISEALALFCNKNAQAVVSVVECEHSPLWANELPKSMSMDRFIRKEVKNKRSQDLPQYFRLNGAIYVSSEKSLLNNNSFFPESDSYAYEMDSMASVDIDTDMDFQFTDFIMKKM